VTAVRRPRYHHGDLRAALVDTAIEVISERGIRGFSLAEASRRLGVAVSAPYAHFADREELLVAVAVHAHELFYAAIAPEIGRFQAPADRLTAMARGYVRFAAANRPLFEMLYEAGLDKARHPEIEQAEQPLTDAFMTCVRALSAPGSRDAAPDGPGGAALADDLASALEATALGHVMLFLDCGPGQDREAVERAADRAARATTALIASRHLLSESPRFMITEDRAGDSEPDPP
jgi:AcrR family transcriptional regulator